MVSIGCATNNSFTAVLPDQQLQLAYQIQQASKVSLCKATTAWITTSDVPERCKSVSDELLEILGQIDFNKVDSLGRKTWKAVGGLVKETEIRDLFGQIERLKSTLGDHLAVINLNQDHEGFLRVDSQVQALKRSFQSGTPEDECLRAMFITDPVSDRESIITAKGRRTPGTCEWITQTEEFRSWSVSPSGLLWISGPPGKGKTFISIFLAELLESSRPDATVISFFCDNKVAFRNSTGSILRCLMTQLVLKHGHLISLVMSTWKVQGDALFGANSFETLWRIFAAMLEALDGTEIYCVLDALDECDEASLSPLLSKLQSYFTASEWQGNSGLGPKAIVASREHPQCLPTALSAFPRIRLGALEDDIGLYISDRVARLARAKGFEGTSLCHHVETTFRDRAEGTFLWVSLMASELEQKQLGEIEAVLTQLPRGLSAVYERILAQINPENQRYIDEMLTWLLFARVPLRIPEICEAIQIKATQHLTREQVCVGYVRSCGHLLQFSATKNDEEDRLVSRGTHGEPVAVDFEGHASWLEDPDIHVSVTFVHQSAKDFLLDRGFDETEAHTAITNRLLSYLSNDRDRSSLYRKAPLMHYADRLWDYHMRQLGDGITNVITENKRFFSKKSDIRAAWWERTEGIKIVNPPLLYMACRLRLPALARSCLLRRNTLLGLWRRRELLREAGPEGFSTPLDMAVMVGDLEIAQLLLRYGAEVQHDHLSDAVIVQSYELFHLLESTKTGQKIIKAEASSLLVGFLGGSLLHLAARTGDEVLCSKLIERYHYRTEIQDSFGETPLIMAIRYGHVGAAEILVKRYAAKTTPHVNLVATALQSLRHKALDLVTKEFGVDINATDEDGNNALHQYFRKDFLGILKLSARYSLDWNHENSKGETILHRNLAAFQTHDCLHLYLRDSQITVNTRDSLGRTPLQSLLEWLRFAESLDKDDAAWLRVVLDFGADRGLGENEEWMATFELAGVNGDPDSADDSLNAVLGNLWNTMDDRDSDADVQDFWVYVRALLQNYATVPINAKEVEFHD
ncbi:hypothetical protein ACJZ2D_000863 [Fusarium nematophilum]